MYSRTGRLLVYTTTSGRDEWWEFFFSIFVRLFFHICKAGTFSFGNQLFKLRFGILIFASSSLLLLLVFVIVIKFLLTKVFKFICLYICLFYTILDVGMCSNPMSNWNTRPPHLSGVWKLYLFDGNVKNAYVNYNISFRSCTRIKIENCKWPQWNEMSFCLSVVGGCLGGLAASWLPQTRKCILGPAASFNG